MNYIKHLTGFFERVTQDKTLNPTHVSLYMSLFQFWNCNRFRNPISISRDEVMRISKISSKATYHKCLKNLHALGYIKYEPSYNPFRGSHVVMFNFAEDLKPQSKASSKNEPFFEPVAEQVVNKQATSDETSTEQALVPSINNTNKLNILNNSNLDKQHEQNLKNENDDFLKDSDIDSKEKKLREKKKLDFVVPVYDERSQRTVEGPKLEEVLNYFTTQNFPELQGNKFFNYFKSIGWLVGGKTPMADWQAAARNWMLNAPKFISHERTDGTKHFDTTVGKDYSEPL